MSNLTQDPVELQVDTNLGEVGLALARLQVATIYASRRSTKTTLKAKPWAVASPDS